MLLTTIAGEAPIPFDLSVPSTWPIEPRWALFLLVLELLLQAFFMVLVILRKGARPSAAMAWLLVIITFPIVGIIMYLLIGESKLGSRRARVHSLILDRFDKAQYHRHDDARAHELKIDPIDMQIATIAQRASHSPPLAGNHTTLLGDSTSSIVGMIADIQSAKQTIHLTSYIWLDDRVGQAVGDALITACTRGVTCRVLVDGHGSSAFLKSAQCATMRAKGVRVVAALPAHYFRALFHRIDIRNHRKTMICDGEIAWLGSMNIAAPEFAVQPRFAPWVDCMVRISGPAAREIQLIFVEDWYLDTDESLEEMMHFMPPYQPDGLPVQIMASGPNYDNGAVRSLLIATIQVARKEIVLTTPYFVPDSDMFSALCVAAQRGVAVHLVLPQRNNSRLVALASRGRYSAMLQAGIQIHEFVGGLLHAKTVCVDQLFSIVTSSNLDRRSFDINFEASAIMYDDGFAGEVRALQERYMKQSVPVTLEKWGEPSIRQRLIYNAAALVSPLI